jgi:hypothetical protein
MIVNEQKGTAGILYALFGTDIVPSCIRPVKPNREDILHELDTSIYGMFGRFDAVVIDMDNVLLDDGIACAIRCAHPQQEVIIIRRGPPAPHMCCATLAPDMIGAITAIKRMVE